MSIHVHNQQGNEQALANIHERISASERAQRNLYDLAGRMSSNTNYEARENNQAMRSLFSTVQNHQITLGNQLDSSMDLQKAGRGEFHRFIEVLSKRLDLDTERIKALETCLVLQKQRTDAAEERNAQTLQGLEMRIDNGEQRIENRIEACENRLKRLEGIVERNERIALTAAVDIGIARGLILDRYEILTN